MLTKKGYKRREEVKVGNFEELEKTLLEWFQEIGGNDLPINGPILD